MVFVSFMDEFPWHLNDNALAVPLDVGRWAVTRGRTPALRRRVAADLRALSRGPAAALTRRLGCTVGAGTRGPLATYHRRGAVLAPLLRHSLREEL